MRILRISGGLDPAFGGPSNSTARAAAADARAGHSVTLALAGLKDAHEASAPLLAWLVSEGVRVRPFPTAPVLGRLGHRFAASPRMLMWLPRETRAADIVHIHGAWPLTSFAGLLCARGYGTPTVLTPHESLTDADVATSRSRARERIKRTLRAMWLSNASTVIFSSELERTETHHARVPTTTRVIPHPVVDERDLPRIAPPPDPAAVGLRLGYLGRFHEKKNLPMLLDAMAELPKEVTLTISGGGYGDENELRRQASRLGLGQRLTWLGFTPYNMRARFWERIDILVVPSRFECFGMVVAEAMERGVPTIVSSRVGAADIVSKHGGGLVVDPSQRGITDGVHQYLEDPDLRVACSAAGRRGALADLTLARYGNVMSDVYQSLVNIA